MSLAEIRATKEYKEIGRGNQKSTLNKEDLIQLIEKSTINPRYGKTPKIKRSVVGKAPPKHVVSSTKQKEKVQEKRVWEEKEYEWPVDVSQAYKERAQAWNPYTKKWETVGSDSE